jgi:hypothetical protein
VSKWSNRAALLVIAVQPLVTTAIMWWVEGAASRGAVLASAICALVQAVLLLWIQSAAEKTDAVARATHKEVSDAAAVDYVKVYEDSLK